MRNTHISTILLAFVMLMLSACKKDTDLFIKDPGQITEPDSTWFPTVGPSMFVSDLKNGLALRPSLNTIDIDGSNADTVKTASGLSCIIPANSIVDSTGAIVTGAVNVESYLLKKKGDLLRMGLPTISNGELLVSRGVFSIKFKKDNEELKLADKATLSFLYTDSLFGYDPGQSQSQLQLFNGSTTNAGQFNWSPISKDTLNFVSSERNIYTIKCNQLNWINCDYFYRNSIDTNKITVAVKLPPYFTNANTAVSIVFSDIRSMMAATANATTKTFNSAGRIPVGLNAKIVTITKDGNFYYLGQQDITTALPSSGNVQEVTITPVRYSVDDISAYLDSL